MIDCFLIACALKYVYSGLAFARLCRLKNGFHDGKVTILLILKGLISNQFNRYMVLCDVL